MKRWASVSFEAEMRGSRNIDHSNYGTDYFRMDGEGGNELVLRGRSADYLGVESKLLYEGRARFENEGGHITMDDSWIKVENADVIIVIRARTNDRRSGKYSPDPILSILRRPASLGKNTHE